MLQYCNSKMRIGGGNLFKGIQKVSLIDYPGLIVATLFTGGCNFRCQWCHNYNLVDPKQVSSMPNISTDEIQDFLLKRKGKLQGVCITGGEPTLWGDRLAEFMVWCKDNNFKVKIDTNGSRPDVLAGYIENNLVDFIAMDIKNTFDKYEKTVGLDNPDELLELDIDAIKKTIQVIKDSGISHQFRTTVVPELVDRDEMLKMEKYLGESIVYQEYRKV